MGANDCGTCATAIDHCHGTLIVHAGRVSECTDEGCLDLDRVRHTFVVECTDVAGGCPCAQRALDRLSG